jgi:hypothetical protein
LRRKIFQHFANMLPQRFLDLPSGFDLAVFAKHRRGVATFDVLNGRSEIDGTPVADLRTGAEYRAWLAKELAAHRISSSMLVSVELTVAFVVEDIQAKESYGHVFRSANFTFECTSTLRTDEKSYQRHSKGTQAWGFDPPYWTELYGAGLETSAAQQ